MEGNKNRSLFLSPAYERKQEPVSRLIANGWKATRTGISSSCKQMEGDKNRSLFLMPAYGRPQELVSFLIASGWKVTRTGLSSYCQQMEGDNWSLFLLPLMDGDKNRLSTHTLGNGGTKAAESIATLPPFGPVPLISLCSTCQREKV